MRSCTTGYRHGGSERLPAAELHGQPHCCPGSNRDSLDHEAAGSGSPPTPYATATTCWRGIGVLRCRALPSCSRAGRRPTGSRWYECRAWSSAKVASWRSTPPEPEAVASRTSTVRPLPWPVTVTARATRCPPVLRSGKRPAEYRHGPVVVVVVPLQHPARPGAPSSRHLRSRPRRAWTSRARHPSRPSTLRPGAYGAPVLHAAEYSDTGVAQDRGALFFHAAGCAVVAELVDRYASLDLVREGVHEPVVPVSVLEAVVDVDRKQGEHDPRRGLPGPKSPPRQPADSGRTTRYAQHSDRQRRQRVIVQHPPLGKVPRTIVADFHGYDERRQPGRPTGATCPLPSAPEQDECRGTDEGGDHRRGPIRTTTHRPRDRRPAPGTWRPSARVAHRLGLGGVPAGCCSPTKETTVIARLMQIEAMSMTLIRGRERRSFVTSAKETRRANGRAVAPVRGMATRHTQTTRARRVESSLVGVIPRSRPQASAAATTHIELPAEPHVRPVPEVQEGHRKEGVAPPGTTSDPAKEERRSPPRWPPGGQY